MNGLGGLGRLWGSIQAWLFPTLREELGELDEKQKEFVAVCELAAPQDHMAAYRWAGVGCPPKDRLALCKAFIAKAVWDFPTTRALMNHIQNAPVLRRLCGWETFRKIPSEATFSRAFAAFAEGELPQRTHEAMLKQHYADKLAGHISMDSTAIEAREKAVPAAKQTDGKTPETQPSEEQGDTTPELPRLQQQLVRPLQDNLADLPQPCDWGCKKDSKGKGRRWRGYKLHHAAIDGDIPVAGIVTSASLHDSQAAIPLMQLCAERVVSLYDLADAAYDAGPIREMSARLGHVALIDHNPRRGQKREFAPAQARRYDQRTSAERVNSHLHDSHGGRHVRVRGAVKVAAHLSFGLLVIAAEQLLKLLC